MTTFFQYSDKKVLKNSYSISLTVGGTSYLAPQIQNLKDGMGYTMEKKLIQVSMFITVKFNLHTVQKLF